MKKWVLTIGFWLLAVSAYAQPKGVELDTLKVQHIDFQGQPQQGIIICNKKISNDLREIFAELYKAKYPIERIRPISEYDDNDTRHGYRHQSTLQSLCKKKEGWHPAHPTFYCTSLCQSQQVV